MGLKIAVGFDFVRMFAIQTRYFCYSSQGGCSDAFKSMSLKRRFPCQVKQDEPTGWFKLGISSKEI